MRLIVPVAVAVIVAGALIVASLRAKRRRSREIPELNQHPERLEQMLDSTDDA
ncbi:MAG TPA: hypothetical protein VFZ95_03235 [Steroidobacteraceae bacterium]